MPKPETRARRRALLRDAKALLRRRYRELDLDLAQVAEALGTSPRQLQRVFRDEGDDDFRSYLLKLRMEQAARMLKRGLAVRRIAPTVGYRKPSGLRQAFIRYYGVNPSTMHPPTPDELYAEPDRQAIARMGQRQAS